MTRQHVNIQKLIMEKNQQNEHELNVGTMCQTMLAYMVYVFNVQQTELNVNHNMNRFELHYMNSISIFTSHKQQFKRINSFETKPTDTQTSVENIHMEYEFI